MQSKLRRRPNCFNLLHQLRLLGKFGEDMEKAFWFSNFCCFILAVFPSNFLVCLPLKGVCPKGSPKTEKTSCKNWAFFLFPVDSRVCVSLPAQVWEDVSQFQTAYQLGAGEAAAAFNLLTEVAPAVTSKLEAMVQSLVKWVVV